jgi:small subunit ribosomal protein S20
MAVERTFGESSVANIKSAKKRAIQSESHRKHNIGLKSTYRTYVKKVETAIAANKKEEALKALKESTPILDKVAAKGIIHKNKAARYKSRLNDKIKKLK